MFVLLDGFEKSTRVTQFFIVAASRKNNESPKKFLMLFGFLMPCIAIVCCYSAIFCKVRQSRRNVQSHMAK